MKHSELNNLDNYKNLDHETLLAKYAFHTQWGTPDNAQMLKEEALRRMPQQNQKITHAGLLELLLQYRYAILAGNESKALSIGSAIVDYAALSSTRKADGSIMSQEEHS
ncbi:hypothetical protein [Entomobacter blattae]|uniref:Uncharacterized protein n=1 Tax=Entomobacter blattae TaxID=2762277 RepID=A0A7H1NUD6_9PROT|nr:hypothetical protein [Entomobacter blattae]QNT79396.1 hypothetical protein JGUZn3_21950 [Entomobacter blattae]